MLTKLEIIWGHEPHITFEKMLKAFVLLDVQSINDHAAEQNMDAYLISELHLCPECLHDLTDAGETAFRCDTMLCKRRGNVFKVLPTGSDAK